MITTEVLTPEALDAMPDAELLLRMQRLRRNIDHTSNILAEHRENPYSGHWPDFTVKTESNLNDWNAALKQVRDEGMRRVRAARTQETAQ